ncbi:MAG: hypothetical protein ACRDJE_11680 [Dehalococcoidia bacterium]
MSRAGPIDPSTMTEEMHKEWAILTAAIVADGLSLNHSSRPRRAGRRHDTLQPASRRRWEQDRSGSTRHGDDASSSSRALQE